MTGVVLRAAAVLLTWLVAGPGPAATGQSCEFDCRVSELNSCGGSDTPEICRRRYEMCVSACRNRATPPTTIYPEPAGGFGAYAISGDGSIIGHAKNWDTRDGALAGAIESCRRGGRPGCRALTSYRNTCAALAIGGDGGWSLGESQIPWAAKDNAIRACERVRAGCTLRSFHCSGQAW